MRLFVQTSSGRYQIALAVGAEIVFDSADIAELDGCRDLQKMLVLGLRGIGREINALKEVVVDAGPGGLAATRAGAAFSSALAYALNLKVKQVGALELLCVEASLEGRDSFCVVRRGPPGTVHWRVFHRGVAATQSCIPLFEAISSLKALGVPKLVAGDIRSFRDEYNANIGNLEGPEIHWLDLNHARMASFFDAQWYEAPTSNGIASVTPLTL